MRWTIVVGLVALAGCGDEVDGASCPPAFVDGPDGCVFDEDAVAELARTFDDGRLERIDAEPFLQYFGPSIRRSVWVAPVPVPGFPMTAADLYRSIDPESEVALRAEFPVGTVIVHQAVDGEQGNAFQVKREAGYDDGTGRDWWTSKLWDDGTVDDSSCQPCSDCHTLAQRPGTEGLWGVPRDAL